MGIYGPHIYRPTKTVSTNNETIAMKFDIEIVCTQEIIMGWVYMSLEKPTPMSMLSYETVTCYLFTGAELPFMQILGDTSFKELTSMWCQNNNHKDKVNLPINRV